MGRGEAAKHIKGRDGPEWRHTVIISVELSIVIILFSDPYLAYANKNSHMVFCIHVYKFRL